MHLAHAVALTHEFAASNGFPGRTYRYLQEKPLYTFGFGRSFTTFSFSNLHIQPTTIKPCQIVLVCLPLPLFLTVLLTSIETTKVSADVSNTGAVAGGEVAQLYIQPTNSSIPWPLIQLSGFERVFLKPGQTTNVKFVVTAAQMAVVREYDFTWQVEEMGFRLFVGGGLPGDSKVPSNTLSGGFSIVGTTVPLSTCPH